MPLGHHHNLEDILLLAKSSTSVLTNPPLLVNPTSNEAALLAVMSNPCFDARKDCAIVPILDNPTPCEEFFIKLLLKGGCKTILCNLIPMFPEPCSPNLTKLILFVTPPQPGGSGGLVPGVPPVVQPCDDFNRAFNFDLGPDWFDSQGPIDEPGLTDTLLIWVNNTIAVRSNEDTLPQGGGINPDRGVAWWSANTFSDTQSSEATITALPSVAFGISTFIHGLGIRMSGIWSNFTAYVAVILRPTTSGSFAFRVYRVVNCSTVQPLSCWVQVGSDITPVPVVGDTIKLAISSIDVVTVDVNGSQVFIDSDITLDDKPESGNPGFVSATIVANEFARSNWDDWCGTGAL